MNYAIAFGGIAGTYLLAYALLGKVYPPLKRWSFAALGLALAATLWIVHPNISGTQPDGSSLSDWW